MSLMWFQDLEKTPFYPNESFSSWFSRMAHSHGYSSLGFIELFDYQMNLRKKLINSIKDVDRPSDLLRQLLLEYKFTNSHKIYSSSLKALEKSISFPWFFKRFQQSTLSTKPVLRWCPTCLSETPYFRLKWRSGSTIICSDHKCLLETFCPNCNDIIDGWPILNNNYAFCPNCQEDLSDINAQKAPNWTLEWEALFNDLDNHLICSSRGEVITSARLVEAIILFQVLLDPLFGPWSWGDLNLKADWVSPQFFLIQFRDKLGEDFQFGSKFDTTEPVYALLTYLLSNDQTQIYNTLKLFDPMRKAIIKSQAKNHLPKSWFPVLQSLKTPKEYENLKVCNIRQYHKVSQHFCRLRHITQLPFHTIGKYQNVNQRTLLIQVFSKIFDRDLSLSNKSLKIEWVKKVARACVDNTPPGKLVVRPSPSRKVIHWPLGKEE